MKAFTTYETNSFSYITYAEDDAAGTEAIEPEGCGTEDRETEGHEARDYVSKTCEAAVFESEIVEPEAIKPESIEPNTPIEPAPNGEHESTDQDLSQYERKLQRNKSDEERGEYLEKEITTLAAHIHAATWRLLELIREYDETMAWSGPGLNSVAHWLNWKCGMNLGAARERVRVAHALPDLPKISEKLRLGEVSYSKVRAMTRVATAKNEEYLLMIAKHGTAAHVERVVRNFRKVKRNEALYLDNERHYQRKLDWHWDDDGYLVLKGRFSPEAGAVVVKALELAKDHLYLESKNDPVEVPEEVDDARLYPVPHEYQSADAILRVAEGFLAGAGHDISVDEADDEGLHNEGLDDEVGFEAESANDDSNFNTNIRKSTGGDRYLVHIHTDINTLKAGGDGAQSEITNKANVSAETSRRLSCDASVVHWLENHKGEPLSIGRKSRSIPPSIRRALQRRDFGCRFPGCTCEHYVDAHHIKHWADGGETSMENLVLLCRKHHRYVHEEGFGVHPRADGSIDFTDAKGELIPVNTDGRFRGNVDSLTDENKENGVEITAETGKCCWDGDHMDDNHAMTGMLQLE